LLSGLALFRTSVDSSGLSSTPSGTLTLQNLIIDLSDLEAPPPSADGSASARPSRHALSAVAPPSSSGIPSSPLLGKQVSHPHAQRARTTRGDPYCSSSSLCSFSLRSSANAGWNTITPAAVLVAGRTTRRAWSLPLRIPRPVARVSGTRPRILPIVVARGGVHLALRIWLSRGEQVEKEVGKWAIDLYR